jgi:cell fate regulator YaaT (PSP1 superfamily)
MKPMTDTFIVGIRFSRVGKIYHFNAGSLADLRAGDHVVVETSRGWQLGQVAVLVDKPQAPSDGSWKPVDRRATPRDMVMRQMWQTKEADVVLACGKRVSELYLSGVKVVAAEYSFDGTRLMIMYSTESEDKVELKSLRQDMQRLYAPAQVELRQIGPRDVAKIIGGMGACGLEMRCCLIYEYDTYVAARQQLPKRNKRVKTPQGEGKVVDVSPLSGRILVEIPEVGVREFEKDEVEPLEELEALKQKAQAGCEGGKADCQNNSGGEKKRK